VEPQLKNTGEERLQLFTVHLKCYICICISCVFIAVRLVSEIESLEALDVFGMLKESSFNSLAEVLTDRKVGSCYQFPIELCLLNTVLFGIYKYS